MAIAKTNSLHNYKVEFIGKIQGEVVKSYVRNNPSDEAEEKIYDMWANYLDKHYNAKQGWETICEDCESGAYYTIIRNKKALKSICHSMLRTEYVLDLIDADGKPMVINGIYKDKYGQEYQFNSCKCGMGGKSEIYLRYYTPGPGWQHTNDIYEPDQFKCGQLTFVRMW